EARLAALEATASAPSAPGSEPARADGEGAARGGAAAEDAAGTPSSESPLDVLRRYGVSVSGYVQAQYEWSDLSEDELGQGGIVLNRNRFSIRRGRVRLAGAWEHFAFELELDGSTTRGPFFGLRRTTVGVLWR